MAAVGIVPQQPGQRCAGVADPAGRTLRAREVHPERAQLRVALVRGRPERDSAFEVAAGGGHHAEVRGRDRGRRLGGECTPVPLLGRLEVPPLLLD